VFREEPRRENVIRIEIGLLDVCFETVQYTKVTQSL
jgi:hypothetical protein